MRQGAAPRADRVGQQETAYKRNRKLILQRENICGICGKQVDKSIKNPYDPMAPTVDHIIPIAKGGHPSDISNLQLAHRICNRLKSDKILDYKTKFKEEEMLAQSRSDLPLHLDWSHYGGTSPVGQTG